MDGKSNNTKLFSILAYIGILWLIGLLCDKDNETVKFHVNQGIWLTILSFIGSFICIGGIIGFVFMIIGIVNAANGEQKYLPLFDKLPAIVK